MTAPRPTLPLGQRPRVLEMQGVDKTFNGSGDGPAEDVA